MPDYEGLREHYQKGKPKPSMFDWFRGNPLPPAPSRFQRDVPVVTSNKETARTARKILDLDPRTKSNVSSITVGPSPGSMDIAEQNSKPLDTYAGIWGAYRPKQHDIGISPGLTPDDEAWTLAHEIGHAAGYDELGARRASQIFGVNPSGINVSPSWYSMR